MKKVLNLTDEERKFIISDNDKYKKTFEDNDHSTFQEFESLLQMKRVPEKENNVFPETYHSNVNRNDVPPNEYDLSEITNTLKTRLTALKAVDTRNGCKI